MPDISVNRTTYIKLGNNQPITTGIAEGSMLIDRVLFAQDFLFGQFASSRFEIQIYGINNVAGQNIEVYQMENGARTDLFVGQIESSKLDNAGYYRDIIAYDKFYFIAKKNVADWFNGLWTNNTQISVLDAFKSLLTYFDIDYDTNTVVAANFTGNLYKTSVPSFEKISFKDMVKFLLEPLALIPYINASGDVAVYAPLMANNIDLYPLVDGVRQTRYDTNQSVFEEYEVLPMQWVGITNIDSAILAQEEITGNTSDIRYDLPYNPIRLDLYVEDAETAQEAVLEDFIDKASFDAYTPCEVFMIVSDMSIKLGDKITTARGTSCVSEMILSGPMLVEQQLISRGSQVQQEVEEEYDPVFAYLDNRITETAEDLQEQLDDFQPSEEYLEKVGEFSDTIAGGMGLQVITYKAQDGSVIKYFYAPPPADSVVTGISGSNFIFTMKSTGFAWTNKWEGAPDASSESHVDPVSGETVATQWTSGISANGNAILKILNAYKISADIIEGGVLEIKDAQGNIVHRFSNIDGSASIGNGGITYDTTNGLQINSNVIIGAVEDAVADLDINSIDHQEVAYAISANGTTPPADGTDSVTETWYFASSTAQNASQFYSTYENQTSWKEAIIEADTASKINGVYWDDEYKYLYSVERTDHSDGTYELSNLQLLSTFGRGNGSTVLETSDWYMAFDYQPVAQEFGNYEQASIWNPQTYNGTAQPYITNVNLTATKKYLYKITRTIYQTGSAAVSYELISNGSGSSSSVLATDKWYYAYTSSTPYSATIINNRWFDDQKDNHGKHWHETNWGWNGAAYSNSYNPYLYTLTRTVYQNGSSEVTNVQLVATRGESYPPIESDSFWSSTIPDTSSSGGMYLWTRTTTVFTDGSDSVAYTKSYIAQDGQRGPAGPAGVDGKDGKDGTNGTNGTNGSDGTGISSVTQYYYASNSQSVSNVPAIGNSAWKTLPSQLSVPFSQGNPYLWTYTQTSYTTGNPSYTTRYIVGVWGQDGDSGTAVQGRGIVSITPQYALSTSESTAPESGWSENIPEYPTTTSPIATGTVTSTQSSPATVLTGLNLLANTSYTITIDLDAYAAQSATVGVYKSNGSQYTLIAIGNQYQITQTFNPGTDLPNCSIKLNTGGLPLTYKIKLTGNNLSVRYYYWQCDLITFDKADSQGHTTQTTTAIPMKGFNAAVYNTNRLNPLFAETYLQGSTQVMIDAGHIFANSVTAYQAAFTEAFIKQLMAHYVRVDGNVDVVDGDITVTQTAVETDGSNMSNTYLDTFCQQRYGKTFENLSSFIKPYALMLATTQYMFDLAAAQSSNCKVTAKTSNGNQTSSLYPNALLVYDKSDTNNKKYAYYGTSALITGDVKIDGTLTAGNIQKGITTISVGTDGYSSLVSITFDKAFENIPIVVATPNFFVPKYAMTANVSDISKTGFKVYLGCYNWQSTNPMNVDCTWIAIS